MTLNASQYNAQTYNRSQAFLASVSTDDIIFNGLGLQNINISTSFKDDDNFPTIELTKFQNPMIDGGGVLKRRYTEKKITLKGFIKADSAEDLNNFIDLFKQKTSVVEGYLDIKVNGYYRRTKATVVANKIFAREHYNITVVPYELQLSTLEPFFYNRTDETITDVGITGNHSMEFRYYGTAPSQPRVYLVFGTTSGTDEIVFKLNDRQITVSQAITTGDILLFDSITKSIFLNGTEIDYVGAFPQIIYGDNLFQFEINGTPNLDITILYATNFL